MSLTYFEGENLSGRSEALKAAVWRDGHTGQYVHPSISPSFSGLAATVGGELYLHGVHPRQISNGAGIAGQLPLSQSVASLSGGQQVRLAIACALGMRPDRLAIDGVLGQLDPVGRSEVLDQLTQSSAKIFLADDSGHDIESRADQLRRFVRAASTPDLNGCLDRLLAAPLSTPAPAPSIELDQVSFRYRRGPRVYDRTSLCLSSGRIYLLKAANGAGKSTLARLLVGVQRPSAGRFLVNGHQFSPSTSNANLIFYGFQNPFDQLHGGTVRAYVSRLAKRASARPSVGEDPGGLGADEVLALSGLEGFADAEPFELPTFVAKRLSIVASLVSRSPWLFFDEPAYGTDSRGRAGLRALFERLAAAGRGVIVVSHGTEFDDSPSACMLSISNGKLIQGG